MDELRLNGLKVVEVVDSDEAKILMTESVSPLFCCPGCASIDNIKFGSTEIAYRDLPIDGKYVKILLKKKRFRCRQCGRTYSETLDMMSERHMMTQRLVSFIREQSAIRSRNSISKEVGVDEKTVRNILFDLTKNT